MERKTGRSIAAMTVALSLLTACGVAEVSPTPTAEPTPVATQEAAEFTEFVLPWAATVSFHPITGSSKVNLTLAPLVYEGLFESDKNFQPHNVLCESYTVSEDSLTWTLTLAEATFSDGSPVTAAEVMASLNLARQSERYAGRLRDISKVSAGEGGTVVITLSRANGALAALLDIPVVKVGENADIPLGTGAYVLTRNEAGEYLLTAREGADVPKQTIALRNVGSSDDLIDSFDAGEISLVEADLNGSNTLGFSGHMEITDYPTGGLLYLGFNLKSGYGREVSVRQAVSRALDRAVLVRRYLDDHATAAALPIHPRAEEYDRSVAATLAQDRAAAGELLAEAGWTENEEGVLERKRALLSLKLIVNQENTAKAALADAIADELRAIGCTVTVEKLPWEDFTAALKKGNFDLYLGETVLTADFDGEVLYGSNGTLNYGGYSNSELDTLLNEYRSAFGEERQTAATALWTAFAEEAPIVAICFKNGSVLTQWGQVSGLSPTQRNLFYGLENWSIEE